MIDIRVQEEKIKKFIQNKKVLVTVLIILVTIISFVLRFGLRKIIVSDMNFFLVDWMETIKKIGIKNALGTEIGDYNIPYLVLLCMLVIIQKIIPICDVTLIKLSSIMFDYIGAIFIGLILYEILKENKNRILFSILGYTITLCLPSVIINSSMWGQCDFIYVSFVLVSLYALLKDKITVSFIFLGVSLAFKLQCIFILPVYVFLYFKKNDISIFHFTILPIVNIIACLPAIIFGRGFINCLTIYFKQTQSYGQMTLNFPNLYTIIRAEQESIAMFGILLTFLLLIIFFFYLLYKKYDIKKEYYIDIAIISIGICTYFLPHMHERYAFAIIILLLLYSFINKEFLSLILSEIIFSRAYSSFFSEGMTKNELELYGILFLGIIISIIFRLFKKLEKI